MIKLLKQRYPFVEEGVLLSKLIAYCSKEAHSSVEKACMIGFVKLRILETDSKFSLRGGTLRNAIHEDRSMGLIPFFVSQNRSKRCCLHFNFLNTSPLLTIDNTSSDRARIGKSRSGCTESRKCAVANFYPKSPKCLKRGFVSNLDDFVSSQTTKYFVKIWLQEYTIGGTPLQYNGNSGRDISIPTMH